MFTLYTVLLTLHILFVTAWLGAGIAVQTIARLSRDEPQAGVVLNRFSEPWFPAVTGLTALTGLLLWIDGPWEFGEVWVLIAVAGWLISSFLGATKLGPAVKRWSEGDVSGRDALFATAPIDMALLILIVADMVMKPGL